MHLGVALLPLVMMFGGAQESDQAKKLFDAMEQKLTLAKTQRISFEATAKDNNGSLEMKGTLLFSGGNRVRLFFDGRTKTTSSKVTIVSDGKKLAMQAESGGKVNSSTKDVPGHYSESLAVFSRAFSLLQAINATIVSSKLVDPSNSKPFAFKSLGQEKIGNKDSNVIEYKIRTPDAKNLVTCKVWLDTKTNLPAKRQVEVASDGPNPMLTSTESISEWELDPKLPDGTFSLPK